MDDDRNVGLEQSVAVCGKKTVGKRIKLVLRVTVGMIAVSLLLLTVALVGVRLVGLTPYPAKMLSAAPDNHPGDMLYVHRIEFSNIHEDDTVIYVTADNLAIAAHRVLSVDHAARQLWIGDEGAIEEGRLLGVVVFSVPWLGFVSVWLTGSFAKYGAMCLLMVLAIAIIHK